MAKRLRKYPIYLAPKIVGLIKPNGFQEVFDEKNEEYLNTNAIDDKIKIYERQVKEWFLNRASRLLKGGDNGFIVLMICISYIEGVQQYIDGRSSNGNSGAVFTQGLNRIFSLNVENSKLNDFYRQVRCGLFHNGMSGNQVIISYSYPQPIDFSENNTIKINPKILLNEIRKDFSSYIATLKEQTNVTEREKFNRMFSVQ